MLYIFLFYLTWPYYDIMFTGNYILENLTMYILCELESSQVSFEFLYDQLIRKNICVQYFKGEGVFRVNAMIAIVSST